MSRALPFTDLQGSTALYSAVDDSPAYALVRDHFAVLQEAIETHRGALIKTIGDAVMAAFSCAADGVAAAAAMHRGLAALTQGAALGDDIVVTAALLETASVGALVEAEGLQVEAFAAELKGFEEPLQLYRLRRPADD